MLTLLRIENIAVIEQAEIVFDSGLNVLTGETGAGKSIIIDAISAILGERTYRDLIRTGCSKASVTAVFQNIPEHKWFSVYEVPYDPQELMIRREIHADGKNICRVNGAPVSVSVLRELGRALINIHGQNETQTLFDEQTHLDYLDLASGHERELKDYALAYDDYSRVLELVKKGTMDEGERLRRIEALEYQIAEIQRAELRAGEDEELLARKRVLQNAEKLSDALSGAMGALSGTESFSGAVELLSGAGKELGRIASYDERYAAFSDTLKEALYSVQDVFEELRNDLDDLSYSAGELEGIESRLDVIGRLQKKYGASVAAVLEYCDGAMQELEGISDADSRLEKLRAELQITQEIAMKKAWILHDLRETAAKVLSKRIEDELRQLDMPSIQFCVQFEETELSADGIDLVRFFMSANAGEALKPLSKVASGGELARIMLAMKNVLSEKDRIPTLIFDEVDAGVSGRAAQKVAVKLRSVSRGKQVFCVTHLPQIAAAADTHLLIAKEVRDGRTYTSVDKLSHEGRVEELARIIGGADITENTRKSAEDMLKHETA